MIFVLVGLARYMAQCVVWFLGPCGEGLITVLENSLLLPDSALNSPCKEQTSFPQWDLTGDLRSVKRGGPRDYNCTGLSVMFSWWDPRATVGTASSVWDSRPRCDSHLYYFSCFMEVWTWTSYLIFSYLCLILWRTCEGKILVSHHQVCSQGFGLSNLRDVRNTSSGLESPEQTYTPQMSVSRMNGRWMERY